MGTHSAKRDPREEVGRGLQGGWQHPALEGSTPWGLAQCLPPTSGSLWLPTGHPAWVPELLPARRMHLRAGPSVAPSQLGYLPVPIPAAGGTGEGPPPTPAPCHSRGCRPPRALGTFLRGGGRSSARPALRHLQPGWGSRPCPRGPGQPGWGGRPPVICGLSKPLAAPAQVPHPSQPRAPHEERDSGSSGQAILPSCPGPSVGACPLKASLSCR